MKRLSTSDKLMQFTYNCGCKIFVTMDLAQSPPTHYHHGEFNQPKEAEDGAKSKRSYHPKSRA